MEYYKIISKCRICGSEKLDEVLSLGEQYIGTTFVKDNSKHPMSKVKIPLTLLKCSSCELVQLRETTNPDLLYRDYYYRTSVNDTMKTDLKDVVDCAAKRLRVPRVKYFDYKDFVVIDMGANDMTMIQMFPEYFYKIGVEPAKNIDWSNVDKSVCIVNDYFNKESIEPHLNGRKARIITSCACFYDLDNPNEVVADMKELLHEDGILVIQVSHLLATVKDMNAYDLCHEHTEYYSLQSLEYLLKKHDLEIFDASTNFVNGGSLRAYICHKDSRLYNWKVKTESYNTILNDEKTFKINDLQIYDEFGYNISKMAKKIYDYVSYENFNGRLVLGLGASTKGNVLLQICNITKDMMPFISDRSPIKIGKFTLGTNIELISEEVARHLEPSVFFVLPYNFKEEIVARESEYIKNGGRMLFAMPYPYVLDKFGEHKL